MGGYGAECYPGAACLLAKLRSMVAEEEIPTEESGMVRNAAVKGDR